MITRTIPVSVLVLCLVIAVSGCDGAAKQGAGEQPVVSQVEFPPEVAGTISEYTWLIGGAKPVQGYGVVMGLGRNGSVEVPPHLKEYLTKQLGLMGFGSAKAGTFHVTPTRILRDPDTTIVLVGGTIPPGAPEGERFDVYISGPQARSLDGGVLLPTEMRLAIAGVASPGGPTRQLADASGAVFVNPFINTDEPGHTAKLKQGRIIGGGEVTSYHPLRLQLRTPDYARARLIERKINYRFDPDNRLATANRKVANAKSPSLVELSIPTRWRHDYTHFLRLVTHLYLPSGPGVWEIKARQIAESLEQPDAKHEDLALIWEAMGSQILPIVERYYSSTNADTAFYAARTGLRLGDRKTMRVLESFALKSGSPLQIPAIDELGNHRNLILAVPTLRKLLNDDNDLVKFAAYEALRRHGDSSSVTTFDIGGQFTLDEAAHEKRPI